MAAISLISIIWKNFKLPNPPKFGSLVFQVLMEMEYHWKTGGASFLFSELSIGSFFPYVPFQHLCVATLKTFMHGHLPHESPMCSFTLPDILFLFQVKICIKEKENIA